MPRQVLRKGSRPARVATRRVAAPPREQAQGQLQRAVREIEKAIVDVQRGLASAERRIEADARRRIRGLQKEGRAQMRALEARRREATRLLGRLSAAAGGSWDDVSKTVQTMAGEARTAAASIVERFRSALS
jgi:hypothetical protein